MISIKISRDENGVISYERELTQEEKETLIATCFAVDVVNYYFIGDELPY
jgi:hypothetical protein